MGVEVWDRSTGRFLHENGDFVGEGIAFLSSGAFAYAVRHEDDRAAVRIVDGASGTEQHLTKPLPFSPEFISFSPDDAPSGVGVLGRRASGMDLEDGRSCVASG